MKLYRVTYTYQEGTHGGYGWYGSLRAARAARHRWIARGRDEPQLDPGADIELVHVPKLTRANLIEFLNRHATHPNKW